MPQNFHADYRSAVDNALFLGFLNRSGNNWRSKISYGGHGFWIHPIRTAMANNGSKTVTGHISHILGWGRPDDQIYFTLVFDKVGKLTLAECKVSPQGFSSIATTVVAAIGAIVAIFNGPAGVAIVNSSTKAPEVTRPIENLFAGTWQSVLNMLLAEIGVQTVPALRFYWSYGGDFAGKPGLGYVSVNTTEPADPFTWSDNFILIENPLNCDWKWSHAGILAGYHCVPFREVADPHTWMDNYLCYKGTDNYEIVFNSAGPLQGYAVLPILEPADPDSWTDNFLCYRSKT